MKRALCAIALAAIAPFAGCSSSSSASAPSDAGGGADGSIASDAGAAIDSGDGGSTRDSGSADGSTTDASDGGDAAATSGRWVMGYYVGYDIHAYPIASIDWSGLTHIIFSPMTVNDDLSLNLTFSDEYGTGMADAMALSSAAHAHGVKALLMLGGAGAGANVATAASAAHRAAFVTALLNAMSTLGYDGIDLDWEDSVNLDDLVSLAQALRAASPSILLSYPGGPINANYQTVDARMATLAASLDMFNVQTYSPATTFAGQGWSSWFSSPLSGESSATPIAIDDTFTRYVAAGVPKSKLGMGISFYAICYTGGITGPRQATNGTTQTIVGGDNDYPLSAFFAAGSTFAASTAGEQMRDAVAKEPYLALANAVDDAHCGASTQYIAYEDEASIAAKGAFAKSNGYGGIIVWQLEEGWLPAGAAGGRAQNSLMQALKTAFVDP